LAYSPGRSGKGIQDGKSKKQAQTGAVKCSLFGRTLAYDENDTLYQCNALRSSKDPSRLSKRGAAKAKKPDFSIAPSAGSSQIKSANIYWHQRTAHRHKDFTGAPEMQEAAIPNSGPQGQTAVSGVESPTSSLILDAPLSPDVIIRAEKIEKYYAQPSQNRIQVISATDLSIVPGEILALLGPSGSGKSTMLRMLTGLSTPTAGQVYWHGTPIAEAEINVSIVFQSFALFPWLTVLENVEAPLQARGVAPAERHERSMKMLDMVGLDGFEAAYPKELSGGMRQRVGFARALVVEPEVLFMDEPFSALDVLTAENLRSELLELWAKKTMPTKAIFLVTHNIEEAVLLADRIVVFGRNPGHIRTDFPVQLPQPRDRKSEPFMQLVDYIYKVLTRPDMAPAEAPGQFAEPLVRDQRQMHYQMLPHARPGGIAGLLELLLDKGGRDDMYRLADDLAFEIDDLLPIVDAAQLLGFLKVEEGDAVITPSGEEFANSEILRQKELFRSAAVDNVLLLRQIRRALDSKSDHTVPEDFFLDILDEQFSEEEGRRQVETAVTWGRYAELFDYDAARRRFVLPDALEEEIAASEDDK
jgi:NitT/TauT family transport system ATP-binding protein